MVQTTIIKLTDDLDGTDADETIGFAVDGKTYEIDLSKKNAAALRKALAPFVDGARTTSQSRRGRPARATAPAKSGKTLFSQLDAEEKDQFRARANMPTARRIADKRIQEWLDAGKPSK